eukprot:3268255-Pleurochrysis_carterae.AAC.1
MHARLHAGATRLRNLHTITADALASLARGLATSTAARPVPKLTRPVIRTTPLITNRRMQGD